MGWRDSIYLSCCTENLTCPVPHCCKSFCLSVSRGIGQVRPQVFFTFSHTSAVADLNRPVCNGLFAWPLVMLVVAFLTETVKVNCSNWDVKSRPAAEPRPQNPEATAAAQRAVPLYIQSLKLDSQTSRQTERDLWNIRYIIFVNFLMQRPW